METLHHSHIGIDSSLLMLNSWQNIQSKTEKWCDRFRKACENPQQIQQQVLQTILAENSQSQIGQQYDFASITNYSEYVKRVPIHKYIDLADPIHRISLGEKRVLYEEETIAFELTGGSTQGSKLIPYNASGLLAFQKAILPWIGDLLISKPEIKLGRTYWAISPVTRQQDYTPCGVPIGMVSDAAYFGTDLEGDILNVLAVPPQIAMIGNMEEWRYLTALSLLAAADLSFISVWSPTFLLAIINEIKLNYQQLIRDIATGINSDFLSLPPQPERAVYLHNLISKTMFDSRQIWPQLALISCWTDAVAKAFIPQLQSLFPHVEIQGKGLLATEGVVTLPLLGCEAPVLASESGFFEFVESEQATHPQNIKPNIKLAHELESGKTYRVIITTPSGLYRYDLGDRVLVKGWFLKTPLLEFIGRTGVTSDLCGEKLTEDFAFNQVFNYLHQNHLHQNNAFAMLAPSFIPKPHYILFVDGEKWDKTTVESIATGLDLALQTNPQYEYARKLGQLDHLVIKRVKNPMETYTKYALSRGQRLGDIKPPVLNTNTNWEAIFSDESV